MQSRIGVLAECAGDLAEIDDEPSRRWRQRFADRFGIAALTADPMHVAAFVVARARGRIPELPIRGEARSTRRGRWRTIAA